MIETLHIKNPHRGRLVRKRPRIQTRAIRTTTSDHYGHPSQAIANYQRAVALRRELGDHHLEAVALTRLGDLHHGNGNAAAADEAWHQALAILDELAHPDAAKIRARLMDSSANCD